MNGPMSALTNRLDWLLNDAEPRVSFFPPINVWEEGDHTFIEAEVPGLTLKDIEVSLNGAELVLKGEKKFEAREDASYYRRERVYGQFTRTIELPWEIAADKVDATLKDGLLTIRLPKSEAAKPRKVEVKYLEQK